NDSEREDAIIYRLSKNVPDQMKIYIKELYKTMFHTSKSYQTTLMNKSSKTADKIEEILSRELQVLPVSAAVACQGIKGANSGAVAKKIFPISDITYFKNFEGVFSAVEKGLCEFGVLPIENSTAGSVSEVYDLMKKYNFSIVRSARVKIEHCLVSRQGVEIGQIKKVISHPQALSQCAEYLKKLGVETEAVENTAVAAKMVGESNDVTLGALCSSDCAEVYGLKILEKSVQDSAVNSTRFICISKNLEIYKGADRISIVMGISHKPGSLNNVIGKFSALGLNLAKIESRPIPNSEFEFMFYFDFEGDVADKKVRNLIAELENGSDKFIFLGAYKELV
ncbi:MAG: bifunctional chorismate mutase/prephenate dehydratase, partial [Clostridia bacterium]|nr:bifunctional chorismate mutase/prephenate dehydratase [Clostridia bacterium]